MEDRAANEDSVLELVDEALAERDLAGSIDVRSLIVKAGPLWPDVRECLILMDALEDISDLFDQPGGVEPLPKKIDRFYIVELLGQGGYSRVYQALDPVLERQVALKTLKGARRKDAAAVDATMREAKALAQLNHEAVAKVLEVGEEGGLEFIVMELVDGAALSAVIPMLASSSVQGDQQREDPVASRLAERLRSVESRAELVAQVAEAVHYCHGMGVVHRDLKPANLLIDEDAQPTVIDFGLASFSEGHGSFDLTENLVGTALYLAPEQIRGERIGKDPRTDVFALGAILHELLTLQPLRRTGISQQQSSDGDGAFDDPLSIDPSLPRELGWIVGRACEVEPEKRYATAEILARDLRSFLERGPIHAGPPSRMRRMKRWGRRYSSSLRVGMALFLVVIGAWGLAYARTETQARSRALESVTFIESTLQAAGHPSDFDVIYSNIAELAQSTDPEDATFWGRLWREPLRAEVMDLRTDADRACLEQISDETRAACTPLFRSDQRKAINEVADEWRGVFARSGSASIRDRWMSAASCELDVSGIETLYAMNSMGIAALRPYRVSEGLLPGYYRARSPTEGWEIEFTIFPRQLICELHPVPLADEEARQMVLVKSSDDVGHHIGDGGSILVDRADTSCGEVLGKFSASERSWLSGLYEVLGLPLVEDAPVEVGWSIAQEYAQRVGKRLPTASELWEAHLAGAIQVDAGTSRHYWTSSFTDEGRTRYSVRLSGTPGGEAQLGERMAGHDEGFLAVGVYLRLATSVLPSPN